MSKKQAWMSNALLDGRVSKMYRTFDCAENFSEPDHVRGAIKRVRERERIGQEDLPTDFHSPRGRGSHKTRHGHFITFGFVLISEESAAVLRDFDMGNTKLYPVRLWYPDKKTRVEGDYNHLIIGDSKNAFLPEHSKEITRPNPEVDEWNYSNMEHDNLSLSPATLEGPDIWFDDCVLSGFFVSDQLYKALKKIKAVRDWRLRRCPIIETS